MSEGINRPRSGREETPVESVEVTAYRVPGEQVESDATLEWDAMTLVLVEVTAGGETGLGYTYSDKAAAVLVSDKLAGVLKGRSAFATRECWYEMIHATRNLGRPGIVSCAIAACDIAMHDLKAKLLGVPAVELMGRRRHEAELYGSGGFTSYSEGELVEQLGRWAGEGFSMVKMKVARQTDQDVSRVTTARKAIGEEVRLFVDANGGYDAKQALDFAWAYAEHGVSWFEEPVSSNDLDGMRLVRERGPAGMEIATGEYGYDTGYFRRLCEARALDVMEADATRCAGFTGFLLADAVADAFEIPLSSHCAPAAHLHCCCAALQLRHMEWFHDHVRIEHMLFEGAPEPRDGFIAPDFSRPGIGISLKRADAEPYRI